MDKVKILNDIYEPLILKAQEIVKVLTNINTTISFYNGHYTLDENKNYTYQFYPIPVISIKGYCDIEFNLEQISITTKLNREAALSYDYRALINYNFSVFGVEDYLSDYFSDQNIDSIIPNISKTNEQQIGFQFIFSKNEDNDNIINFIKWLQKNKFHY